MNKAELSEKIAQKVGISKVQAENALDAFVGIATETLTQGGEVVLTGFGTFSARRRKGREGINPRNIQQKITIPSVVVAKFKAGKNLKEVLKGKYEVKPEAEPESKPEKVPTEAPIES